MTENYCNYKNHPISEYEGYVIYSDEIRGLNDVKMCRHCYGLHILMYYPRSHVADYIKNNPSTYHVTQEEIEKIEIELHND